MSGYAYPVGDIYVSADWQNHKDRNPPSAEPGTDYAAAYGTPIVAAADGVVTYVKTTTSGGTGRYVAVTFDDGKADRDLHMSRCDVVAGQRVAHSQTLLGLSGASGYGSDWYYGPHVHKTLLPTATTPLANSIDFELYVGDNPTPPDQEDDMAPIVITVSIPLADGNQQWWSVNLADYTKALIVNGTQLDFRRAIGIPQYTNQAPQILDGYITISPIAAPPHPPAGGASPGEVQQAVTDALNATRLTVE